MWADYRQLVFSNIVNGMRSIIDIMDVWEMRVHADNRVRVPVAVSSISQATLTTFSPALISEMLL